MPSAAFQIIRDDEPLPDHLRGGVAAIGNFDGVHRGHQAVLARVTGAARAAGIPALAITFEPHPRSFFRPEDPVFRLTPSEVKGRLMASLGVDAMVEVTFDAALAAMAPEAFASKLLVERLRLAHVIVGHDFHFGKARAGTPQVLGELGRKLGFEVSVVEPVGSGAVVYSSRAVRRHLAAGEIDAAAAVLGYRWFVRGAVEHGAKRGRDLGFPTANVHVDEPCDLRHGVYAVRARVDGGARNGVASYGSRPQFDDGAAKLEVHLLDFSGDLYGRTMDVEFVAFLRPEARFESVEALVEQMRRDSDDARRALEATGRAEDRLSAAAPSAS